MQSLLDFLLLDHVCGLCQQNRNLLLALDLLLISVSISAINNYILD